MNNKYEQGKKLCEEIFWKTGDIKYYNMAKGFEDLCFSSIENKVC